MYCAYLLSCGRYDLLEHLLSYSNTIPYSNILVVRSLNDVLNHLLKFEQPFYFNENYSFYLNNGVKDESTGKCWLIILYLICLIKDDKIQDLNAPHDITLLGSYKSMISNIYSVVFNSQYWKSLSNNHDFKCVFDVTETKLDSVREYIKTIYYTINGEIDHKERTQTINQDRCREYILDIRQHVREFLGKTSSPIKVNDSHDDTFVSQVSLSDNIIPKDLLSDSPRMAYVNFTESYAAMICHFVANIYQSRFILNSPVKSYLLDFRELPYAMEKLSIDNHYCILCMGVDSSIIFNGAPKCDIYSIPSQNSAIVILKKKDMPFMELRPDLVDIDIHPIPNEKDCIVKGKVAFSYPDKSIRYIRLNLAHLSYIGLASSLPKVESIKNFIV